MRGRRWRWDAVLRRSGVGVLAGMALWVVGDAALRHAANPAQLNFVEGFIVADALRFANGGPLYNDPRQVPFTLNVYTPLYTALLAGCVRLGLDPFLAGRLLTLTSVMAVAGVVVLAGWARSRAVAITAASLFLLAPLQWPWSLVARPDGLAVALSVAGVALAARRPERPVPLAVVLLFVAAFFTKQTAVAGALSLVLAEARSRPRRALAMAAMGGALAIVLVATLQWASHGWFLFHTVAGNLDPFSLRRAALVGSAFAQAHPAEVLVLLVLLLLQAAQRRIGAVGMYALVACVTALSVGKVGSDTNYFLEPLAATALLAVHTWPVAPSGWSAHWQRPAGAALLAGAVLLGGVHLRDQIQRRESFAAAAPVARQVADRIRALPGAVVSDDATLLLRAGKPVLFQPFVMTQLAAAGRWDEGPFLALLSSGAVAAVVVQSAPEAVVATRYTPAMRAALAARSRPTWGYVLGFPYTVYELDR